jgi:hypothetical protein
MSKVMNLKGGKVYFALHFKGFNLGSIDSNGFESVARQCFMVEEYTHLMVTGKQRKRWKGIPFKDRAFPPGPSYQTSSY